MPSSSTARPAAAQECKVLKDLDLNLAQFQQYLGKEAKEFLPRHANFKYDPNHTAADNFLRLSRAQNWQVNGPTFREKLHLLVQKSLGRIQPSLVSRPITGDFADSFFARVFPGLKRNRGLTYKAELKRLAAQQRPPLSKKQRTQALTELEYVVSSRVAAAIVKESSDIPCLQKLAPNHVNKLINTNHTTGNNNNKTSDKKKSANKTTPLDKKTPADKINAATKRDPANKVLNKSAKQPATAEPPSTRFTDRFPNFNPDLTKDLAAQFDLLAIQQSWSKSSKTYRKQRTEFFADLFEEEWSEIVYTPDETDDEGDGPDNLGVDITKAWKLSQWQDLCNELGVEPLPKTITQCRKALEDIHVNIFDFLEARFQNNVAEQRARGEEGGLGRCSGDGENAKQRVMVRRFESAGALAKYTRATGKIFSKARAKRQGALRALLRHVFGHSGGRVL